MCLEFSAPADANQKNQAVSAMFILITFVEELTLSQC